MGVELEHVTKKTKDPLKDVDRRFGRISGALALVYIAVFAKFGLWQALTERCCGEVETAGVGTAVALIVSGTALIQIVGNGFVYVYCHFRSALAYSLGDVLQCLCWMISLAVICLFSVHRFGETSFQVMSVLFQCIALSLLFLGVTEGFFPLAQEFRQKGDEASYGRLVRVARRSAVKAGLGTSVLLAVCSQWVPGWVGVDGPEAVQATRMLVILVPFLPISALLMVRVAELFEARQVLRGCILVLFKDLLGLAGLTVLGGVFWEMDGLWFGMLAAVALALPLAFLSMTKVKSHVKKCPEGLLTSGR